MQSSGSASLAGVKILCEENSPQIKVIESRTLAGAFNFSPGDKSSLSKLEILLGRKFSAASLIGGGARDRVLCQFTANALGLPVHAGPVEASSAGNILVQMLADGAIANIAQGRDIIRESFDLSTYLPRNEATWEAQYHRFLALAHPEDK